MPREQCVQHALFVRRVAVQFALHELEPAAARKPRLEIIAALQAQHPLEVTGPCQRVVAFGLLEPPAGFGDHLQAAADLARGVVPESQNVPHHPFAAQRFIGPAAPATPPPIHRPAFPRPAGRPTSPSEARPRNAPRRSLGRRDAVALPGFAAAVAGGGSAPRIPDAGGRTRARRRTGCG